MDAYALWIEALCLVNRLEIRHALTGEAKVGALLGRVQSRADRRYAALQASLNSAPLFQG
jgi:hypothetical protein